MELSGRFVKWSVELSEFDIEFLPRTAIKGQILADFVVECTHKSEEPTVAPPTAENPKLMLPPQRASVPSGPGQGTPATDLEWKLYVDGSSSKENAGAGLVLQSPEGNLIEYAIRFDFSITNNGAEYEALLAGLRIAQRLKIPKLTIHSDSQLVAKQLSGEYEAKEPLMKQYLSAAKSIMEQIHHTSVIQIPREDNQHADMLSKLTTAPSFFPRRTILIEHLTAPSIPEIEEMTTEHSEPSWMDPIHNYLEKGEKPADPLEAKRLARFAAKFIYMDNKLYRRGHSHPYLRCVTTEQGRDILKLIHEGECSNHIGAKTLAFKTIRQGYYWPTMAADSKEYVKKCKSCQKHASIPRLPATKLSTISSPWPFYQWGIDILGPFPPAVGRKKYVFVAVDYFTKWAEAKATRSISTIHAQNFLMSNIMCRFGIPGILITDNGTQFGSEQFRSFCDAHGVRHKFSSVAHPQTNGLTEATNKSIVIGLKKRMEDSGISWYQELPKVLWALRTTPKKSTGETPFMLTYGSEAVIPVELQIPSARTENFSPEINEQALETSLDLLEETRLNAQARMARQQAQVKQYYDRRVVARKFNAGDLVLREASVSNPTQTRGKLAPSWEGPYRVIETLENGAYRLQRVNGRDVPRTWNAEHLRRYYQ